jgi:hypothetical protein
LNKDKLPYIYKTKREYKAKLFYNEPACFLLDFLSEINHKFKALTAYYWIIGIFPIAVIL